MNLLNRVGGIFAVLAVCVFCANDLVAQPHISQSIPYYINFIPNYRNMTLDFDDVTGSNVNQTTNETTNNEKEVEFGDYDNDGDLDVVMAVAYSDFGQRLNKLYRNDNGVMNEVSASVVPGFASNDVARSAFFRDFDNDGFLDIVIVCDQNSGTGGFEAPGRTKFYRNLNGTSFVNESNRIPTGGMGAACNGTAEDFNQDGWCDFVMCNYPNVSQDTLYVNQGAGTFQNMTNTLYPQEGRYGVHSEAADMNGDGKLDILMANWSGDPSYIYYNDNMNLGSDVGDFRYGNTTQSQTQFSGTGGGAEVAMIPGDFNNDGLMDFYYANKGGSFGSRTDVIMVNTGNDGNNKATFNSPSQVTMPATQSNETHKVTVNDLDGDGFVDLIVMDNSKRPYIYRNTSVDGGDVSFVQWTPAPAFPTSSTLKGWQANSAQILGGTRPDIFVGASKDDFLFENLKSTEYMASDLGGSLPNFHNVDPISVLGTAPTAQTQIFTRSITSGATVSAILRSAGDVTLEVRQSSNGALVASSEKGFVHTAEAVEFTAPGGTLEFRVTMNRVIYDGDGDGDIDDTDEALMWECVADNDFYADCPVFDLSNSYGVNAFDTILFPQRKTDSQAEEFYVLELVSRTN